VENWNDERLNELNQRVEKGFERAATKEEINLRFDGLEAGVNLRFDEMKQRSDADASRSQRFETKVAGEFNRFTDRLDKLFYIQLFFLISLAAALLTDQA